jgi:hypothetical protein
VRVVPPKVYIETSIVEDIHRIRRELAAEFNGDVHALFQYLRDREKRHEDRAVNLPHIAPEASSKDSSR